MSLCRLGSGLAAGALAVLALIPAPETEAVPHEATPPAAREPEADRELLRQAMVEARAMTTIGHARRPTAATQRVRQAANIVSARSNKGGLRFRTGKGRSVAIDGVLHACRPPFHTQ